MIFYANDSPNDSLEQLQETLNPSTDFLIDYPNIVIFYSGFLTKQRQKTRMVDSLEYK
jgi:hypothetical protein